MGLYREGENQCLFRVLQACMQQNPQVIGRSHPTVAYKVVL